MKIDASNFIELANGKRYGAPPPEAPTAALSAITERLGDVNGYAPGVTIIDQIACDGCAVMLNVLRHPDGDRTVDTFACKCRKEG